MTSIKTTLTAACIIALTTSQVSALTPRSGNADAPTVISDLIGIQDVGPDTVTLGALAALLALAISGSAASSSTSN